MMEILSKDCSRCKETLPLSKFFKDQSKKSGHASYCKECQYANRRVLNKNKEYNLKYIYGLTLEQYEQMKIDQDYRCAWCNRHVSEFNARGFCIDHCHVTGEIRRLLCDQCNKAEGLLNKSWPEMVAIINQIVKDRNETNQFN